MNLLVVVLIPVQSNQFKNRFIRTYPVNSINREHVLHMLFFVLGKQKSINEVFHKESFKEQIKTLFR